LGRNGTLLPIGLRMTQIIREGWLQLCFILFFTKLCTTIGLVMVKVRALVLGRFFDRLIASYRLLYH